MTGDPDLKKILENMFHHQKLAVLATQESAEPYCNLVAFSHSDDLKKLFFATSRNTRKCKNLTENPRVCMLVDNRTHAETDFTRGIVATAFGTASEVPPEQRTERLDAHLQRHRSLGPLLSSEDRTLIQIEVSHYIIISNFEHVSVLQIKN